MDWRSLPLDDLPPGAMALPQSRAHGRACRVLGRDVHCLALAAPGGGGVAATALVLSRHLPILGRAALVSRGPDWRRTPAERGRAEAMAALSARLRAGAIAAMVTPDCDGAVPPRAALAMVTAPWIAEWSLEPCATRTRAALKQKWRNRLARAEAGGLAVTQAPLPADPGHWFLKREAAQARQRGYRGLPPAYAAAYARANPGAARLFEARLPGRGGTAVAAILILLHPPGATYHAGWSGPEGRAAGAHHLLLWQAARWCADRGATRLDLGRIDTETAPGLARFKLGTGAAARPLGASYLAAPGTAAVARLSRIGLLRPGATGAAPSATR